MMKFGKNLMEDINKEHCWMLATEAKDPRKKEALFYKAEAFCIRCTKRGAELI